jgi:hypothetical protein
MAEIVRDRLTDFLVAHVDDPGKLVVFIYRGPPCVLMTAFTYSLTTVMSPSDDAVNFAIRRLDDKAQFHELMIRDKFYNIQYHACVTDQWNRSRSSVTIAQAVLSSAAGLETIKCSDDSELQSEEIAKRLAWTTMAPGTKALTKTVNASLSCVGGIDQDVMDTFVFDPSHFERHFLAKLNEELPALHFAQTLNKIVIYDIRGDNFDTVSCTTHKTTTVVELPEFPSPFSY